MSQTRLYVVFFLMIGLSTAASAAVIHVPGDHATIQTGIDAAAAGDTVLVAEGTWSGPGNTDLRFHGKAITVISASGPAGCTIDSLQQGRGVIFDGGEGPGAVLEGFTITGGLDNTGQGGGILVYDASPTLINNVISGNESSAAGGGLTCYGASPTLEGCTVNANIAGWSGGGVACLAGSSPSLSGCTITGNQAGEDGGGFYCDEASAPLFDETVISGNSAGYRGGGICSVESSPEIVGCTIEDNMIDMSAGEGFGGGVHFQWGTPRMTACRVARNTIVVSGNYDDGYGGGLSIAGGVSEVVDNDFLENSVIGSGYGYGGGIHCDLATVTIGGNSLVKNELVTARHRYGGGLYLHQCMGEISGNTIAGNRLRMESSSYDGWGGGIYCTYDETVIRDNLIHRNVIDGQDGSGGGIYTYYGGNTIVDNQVLENTINGYYGYGAGICISRSYAWVDRNHVSGNRLNLSSSGRGGGIYIYGYPLSVSWNSVVDNRITSSSTCFGGGLYVSKCSPVMIGNVVAGNETSCSTGYGGGMFIEDTSNGRAARLEGAVIENNLMSGGNSSGGGIFCEDSTVYLVQTRVAGNACSHDGGGVHFEDDGYLGPPELKNSQILGNVAGRNGGGVYAEQTSLLMRNTLVIGNSAAEEGGGIAAEDVEILGSTITGNEAPTGPALYSAVGEVVMRDSIAWFNSGGGLYVQGGLPEITYSNLEGGFVGDGNIDLDPLFVVGPGGDHYLSHLAAGQNADSPCLDAGSAPVEDLGQAVKTTRTDESPDTGVVDMGYHSYGTGQFTFTDVSVWPDHGTLPFESHLQTTMRNEADAPRTFAGRIDVALGNGSRIDGWRRGYSNLLAGDAYYFSMRQPFGAYSSLVGENRFRMVVVDVTPAPWNQPPYPPSGQLDSDLVAVHAAAGTFHTDLVCTPVSGTIPFSSQCCIETHNTTLFNRRMAYQVRAYWGGGGSSYYHQSGTFDVGAHQQETFCWTDVYDTTQFAGENEYHLYTRDVTPAPFNQPPYPPSGHTETIYVTVTGSFP